MPKPHRATRFSLGAGMLLIAMTAIGLAATRYVIETMLGGRTSLGDLFSPPERGWSAFMVLRRAQDGVTALLLIVGGWTLVLPFLRAGSSRGFRTRLLRRPGASACVAAVLGIILGGAVMIGTALTARLVDGRLRHSAMEWGRFFVLEQLLIYAGVAVGVTWTLQAIAGRWRPSADWVDRLGRVVGVVWIASGIVWATRPYLALLF